MPAYDFSNTRTGKVREFIVQGGCVGFEDPDGAMWERCLEPTLISVGGLHDSTSQAQQIKQGYHKLEQNGWDSIYSKNKVKKAWGL